MYRFSLEYFVKLFKKCLEIQEDNENIKEKLQNTTKDLFRNVF